MRQAMMSDAEDLQWLRDTHLRGVPLPTEFAAFRFAVLQGNEDAPHAVNLYVSAEPNWQDDYLRVTFDHESPIYCEYQAFDGKTDKPRGARVGEGERK